MNDPRLMRCQAVVDGNPDLWIKGGKAYVDMLGGVEAIQDRPKEAVNEHGLLALEAQFAKLNGLTDAEFASRRKELQFAVFKMTYRG
jgi:hypothetical protein